MCGFLFNRGEMNYHRDMAHIHGRVVTVISAFFLLLGSVAYADTESAGSGSGLAAAGQADAGGSQAGAADNPPAVNRAAGNWVHSPNGKWWWRNADGSYPKSGTALIGGVEYCFDDSGYMRTGWVYAGDGWRFYGDSGGRAVGWVKPGRYWYYVDPASGVMVTGDRVIGGVSYFFGDSGDMRTGWVYAGDGWRFYGDSGGRAVGWVKPGRYWYYVDPASGVMVTGDRVIGGVSYFFGDSGDMRTGWVYAGDGWRFYGDSGGRAVGWVKPGRYWYYVDPASGVMVTGDRVIDGKKYHFASSGAWIVYEVSPWFLQPTSSITPLGRATNTLTPGMNGTKVLIVQKRLGIWNPRKIATADAAFLRAVRNFQSRVGLPATGIVDERTWNALGTGYSWYADQYQATPVSLEATREERIEAMVGYAYAQLGSSYTWGGAGPYSLGFDCSGLALQAIYAGGMDPQPINVIKHAWPTYRTSQELFRYPYFMHVPISRRQRGDLIFYTDNSGTITHVAIYIGGDLVIHTDWMGRPARIDTYTTSYGWGRTVKTVVRPFP